MSNLKGSNVLLTLDDVRAWKREREVAAARVVELDKKLSLVAAFMPEEARIEIFGTAQIPGDPKARDDRATLSKFVFETLGNESRGFLVGDVEGIVRTSEFAEIFKENPTLVEDILLGSARKGRIRKRGDLFFHPSVDDTPVKEEEPVREEVAGREYGAAEYFRGLVNDAALKRRDGLVTADVVAIVKADSKGAQKIAQNAQYAYSLLGRMIAKEFLKKVDGRLYHPSLAPAPSSTTPRSQNEKAADPERDRAVFASEPPAGATLLPFAAQAAE